MRIGILGGGPLVEPLARLAERAGHTVRAALGSQHGLDADDAADLVILAGSRVAMEPLFESLAHALAKDTVVVDATTPTDDDTRQPVATPTASTTEWVTKALPRARIVRAFASVPAEALVEVFDHSPSDDSVRVAVPIASDDDQAKTLVGRFVREIGMEPFDLGALASADVIDPGGALWGKALSQVEMLEAVGWLSGDG